MIDKRAAHNTQLKGRPIDGFHCQAMKNKSKTIQWQKLRNSDVIEVK